MVNNYRPHLIIVPEDDANRQLVNGFLKHSALNSRVLQVVRPVGGWGKVYDNFLESQIDGLRSYPKRRLLLLVDFDGKFDERYGYFKKAFEESGFGDRVYMLGASEEPEKLKSHVGRSYEDIGEEMAVDCYGSISDGIWWNENLRHNISELQRLASDVRQFLFNM